ncbi:MAG: alpha/beta hydrolase [Verrucomicrobiota bacterium]
MDRKRLRRWLVGDFSFRRALLSLLEIYLCVLVYAYFFTDRTIFQPQPSSYVDGPDITRIRTSDGAAISAMYLPRTNAEFMILHSHGNAEDLGDIRPVLEMLRDRGFSVLAYDYRGYGTSGGKASERNAYRDAEAAYAYAVSDLGIPPSRIIVHGRSVGAALALHLAARSQVGGVFLESPFVSAFRMKTIIPLAPFDKFSNIRIIRRISCPVLVVHGMRDEAIPPWHGRKLFDAANAPKLSLWVEGAGHDDVIWAAGDSYWNALHRLVDLIRTSQQSRQAKSQQ